GTYTTHAVLTSWSGATATSDSSFTLAQGPNGAPCAPQGFAPTFKAGPQVLDAGAFSRFALQITRSDSDQELGSVATNIPHVVLGQLASAVPCPDGPANAGTCEDVSKIGEVMVAAGAGSNPFG